MDKTKCRMCAKHENSNNLMPLSEIMKNLIDYYCRIQLLQNDTLPNMLCIDCNQKINDFSTYSERAKEIQMKMVIELEISNVKVEIEELPSLYYDNKQLHLFVDEPKIEISTKSDISDIEDEVSSESDVSSSSDSDFLADIKKRLKNEKPKKKRGRPKKLKSLKDVQEDYTLDVPESARDTNGTVSKSLTSYEGRKWIDIKLECVECQLELKGPFELRNHYFLYHTLDLQYNCPECPETVTSFYQFLNHYVDHHKYLNFCCVICSQMFWNMKSLNMHYRNVHLSADQAIKHCKRCGQYFRKPVDLSNHEIRVHKIKACREGKDIKGALYTMEYIFAEELADNNFKQNKDFDVPESDKNPDGSITDACKDRYANEMWTEVMFHECTDCKERFKSPYLLSLHFNAKHSEEKSIFVCKLCSEDKTFLNFESFINHTFTIHHEHLRFFCFICCKGFWDYKALFQHYKTSHEDYNIFMCLFCGKHHKIGYELKHHLKIHKQQLGKETKREKRPANFTCSLCPKSFPKKTQLQRHLETHKKNETKIWICETCGKNFNAKSTLINHAMVHQNDKPYVCTICGEGFKNKYKLNYHKGIHTGEKNFGCEICGQRFRAKGTLKNHMLIHSGERPWSELNY